MRLFIFLLFYINSFCQSDKLPIFKLQNLKQLDSLEIVLKNKQVKFLYIDIPELDELPNKLEIFNCIQELEIKSNSIKTLPEWINAFNNLENITLNGSNFNLAEVFQTLSQLKIKDVTIRNCNDNIPVNISELKYLNSFEVKYCLIDSLPEEISQINSIKCIWLEGNKIKDANKLFEYLGRLPNLVELVLYENNIDSIPENIGDLKNLIFLRIANNKINTIPESISNLTKLERFFLFCKNFRELPSSLVSLKRLTWLLIMADNNLSKDYIKQFQIKMPWCHISVD